MTIAEIKALADKAWVNGPVVGTVSGAKNIPCKNDKKMGVAKLTGASGETIDIQSFDKQFMSVDGKVIELTGQGLKKDSYNNYPKLMVGGNATMNVIEGDGQLPVATPTPVVQTTVVDDDYVPQTLCHVMGAALQAALADPNSDGVAQPGIIAAYMVATYKGRDLAVAIIRGEND